MHNHPSGDPTPSQADIQMTKAIIDIAAPLAKLSSLKMSAGPTVVLPWAGSPVRPRTA